MGLHSIAEVKECCHAPLASFNVRLADGTSSAAAMPRRKNTSCWIGPHSASRTLIYINATLP